MRYKVIDESQSCHCCFTHTVVDTTKPDDTGGYAIVCECFTEEDADRVQMSLELTDL